MATTVNLTKSNYEKGDILIIRFTADWCAPCKRISETIKNSKDIQSFLDSIAGYIVVDVESETVVTLKGYKMVKPTSIPHFVKLRYDGEKWEEIAALSGAYPEQTLLTWLKK
jgi:hypothetical protein